MMLICSNCDSVLPFFVLIGLFDLPPRWKRGARLPPVVKCLKKAGCPAREERCQAATRRIMLFRLNRGRFPRDIFRLWLFPLWQKSSFPEDAYLPRFNSFGRFNRFTHTRKERRPTSPPVVKCLKKAGCAKREERRKTTARRKMFKKGVSP